MVEEKSYTQDLIKLKDSMSIVSNTPFSIMAKVNTLVTMNMRYEKAAFNNKLQEHPYLLTKKIINDAVIQFNALMDSAFIESDARDIETFKSTILEEKHRELWQEIWSRHSAEEFEEFIDLKVHRLDVNNLKQYVEGSNCVDLGCGNGSFAFALLKRGAKSVYGVDFGEKQIEYAQKYSYEKKISDAAHFNVGEVFNTQLPNSSFDFAISNGVFHHLKPEKVEMALCEVARILKKGGWFWYYVDGKGAISMDLWDTSVEILKDVDILIIENILKPMNIKRNKMVHLMDGLSATYCHSTWEETIGLLSRCGFGNFRRLTGGCATDFDMDRIQADPYGREKFGEGDLRILCQLL